MKSRFVFCLLGVVSVTTVFGAFFGSSHFQLVGLAQVDDEPMKTVSEPDKATICEPLLIKHLVVQNWISPDNSRRRVLIFLDKREYSKENLNRLFTHYSRKYSSPGRLVVRVETNWDLIPQTDPFCKKGGGISGMTPAEKEIYSKYHLYALFQRFPKRNVQYFKYRLYEGEPETRTISLSSISE